MNVFFYGLFMDRNLLEAKGLSPQSAEVAVLENYVLRIGKRATLAQHPGSRVYGIVMDITADEAASLYSEESVADYVPERVHVTMTDNRTLEALCYILPDDTARGGNAEYAASLRALAADLGFPATYVSSIE